MTDVDGVWAYLIGTNRVEVIDETGRAYVFWGKEGNVSVELHKQDGGRTLKVFIAGERR
jgi:hypothetical protein